MTKKVLFAVTAAVLAAGVLAGCGKEKAETDTNKPYEISWYYIGSKDQPDTAAVEEEIKKYLKDSLNVSLKMHCIGWDDYYTKMNVMIAGSEKFDMSWADSDNYRINAIRQAYLPLNDLMDEFAPQTKELLGEEFLKGSQVGGVNYGIPSNKDKGHHWGIMYNKSIVEKYGLEEQIAAVKTLDDFMPIMEFVKEKEPDISVLLQNGSFSVPQMLDFNRISFPAVFYADDDTGKVVNMIATPEFKQACEKSREIYEKGYSPEDIVSAKTQDGSFFARIQQLKPGKAEESSSAKYRYGQIDLTTPRMMGSDTVGSLLTISRTSENPQRVMQFIEKMYTDPVLANLIVYGIEGKHYEKLGGNRVRVPADTAYTQASIRWEFGNTFIHYLNEFDDETQVENMKKYNDNLKPAAANGFAFDPSSVQAEVGACQNVFSEFYVRTVTGSEDPDIIIPQFLEKLERAGADKIISEAQKQYDEWKKSGK
ncbi:MAG: ABC transporter substrate-binding protein [Clostridia bacterium]|nr:ABC transporter substrate-binding protein [Clostridia bacterium]